MLEIYKFSDYRKYLKLLIENEGRGALSRLSRLARVQPSYFSQVLSQNAYLNTEQAWQLAEGLGFDLDTRKYFLLLVEEARASNSMYRGYLKKEMEDLKNSQFDLKSRFQVGEILDEENKNIYFSSYLYAATHILLMISEYNSRESLSKRLKVSIGRINSIVDQLIQMGLVKESQKKLSTGQTRLHLSSKSSQITQHHTNWRIRALDSIGKKRDESIHYSSAISISKEGYQALREKVVNFLSEAKSTIKETKPEEGYVFNLDLFRL